MSEDAFLERKMRKKLSVLKCLDCESKNTRGFIAPFLFHRVTRNNRCPNCSSAHLQKISIYAVMELRWNKTVKPYIEKLNNINASTRF